MYTLIAFTNPDKLDSVLLADSGVKGQRNMAQVKHMQGNNAVTTKSGLHHICDIALRVLFTDI